MKTYLFTIMLCLCSTVQSVAQSISGKVVDEKGQPLPYVNVMLQSLPDSTFTSATATDDKGLFDLPVPAANAEYVLTASYIGYETVDKTCKAGDAGTIVMKEDTRMLDEVNIIASRVQHEANGYTVSLRRSETVKGKQTADALAFLPGVTKTDDSYKINGLSVSEIYVDGVKLTNMDELKNIPADMIDKVKINYLAGSNQNASLTGGTIDIFLRQPPQGGYYGTLAGGATVSPSYGFSNENAGGIIYYRYKNLSIYDNLSLNFNQPEETAEQNVWDPASGLRTAIDENTKNKGHNIYNRLSLIQQINGKNSIGGSYYIATNRLKTSSLTTTGNGASATEAALHGRSNYLDQEATLKYTSTLSQRGTTLEIMGDYYNRQADNRSNYSYSGDNTSSISKDESSLDMYKLSVDLTDPRSQKFVWKYGASIQYILSDYDPETGTSSGSNRFPTSQIATRTKGLTPLAYVSAMGQIWKI